MNPRELQERIRTLPRPGVGCVRDLKLARRVVRFEGLGRKLAVALERRWGGFFGTAQAAAPDLVLRVFERGLDRPVLKAVHGEIYRVERVDTGGVPLVASYHFATTPADDEPDGWNVVLMPSAGEPTERMVDNVARYFAARIAVACGGFALHAAGVRRNGRAYLFAGPSRAGKSTAVALSGAESLGDDFGIVVREGDEWLAAPLPFDNSERIDTVAAPPVVPLAGIWRLFQGAAAGVDRPPVGLGTASLMACAAFPWAIPELADPLLHNVQSYVSDGGFAHLTFAKGTDLWRHLPR